jgi:thioredoxin 1
MIDRDSLMAPDKRLILAFTIIVVGLVLFNIAANPLRIGLSGPTKTLAASNSGDPMELNNTTSDSVINKAPLFVLEFYYPGCGPCKAMNITISDLSKELGGQVTFGRMNIRANSQTAKKYKVASYPTLLVFSEGVLIDRFKENTNKSSLVTELKKYDSNLDISKVKLENTTTAAPTTLPADIPLARVGATNPSMPMLVTDSNLDSVIKSYPFLVLDAFAVWCGACGAMNVTISELSSELQGQMAFGLINVERNSKTKVKYNITSYPTLLVFKNGVLVDTLIGNRAKTVFIPELMKYQPALNTSKVKYKGAQPATAAQAPTPPKEIQLTSLGEKNPSKPMLVTDRTLESAIKTYPFLVLEGFVNWCEFGRMMNVTLSELSDELQGQVAFGLVNVERNSKTKAKYNITSYPTLLIFKNGTLAATVIGNQQKSSFVSRLKKLEPALNTSKVKLPITKPVAPAKPKEDPAKVCTRMNKSNDPVLDAYVVSRCPFGLQIQRIMRNTIAQLPEAAKYLKVRYIGSVSNGTIISMHGDGEAQENLRQMCIREEQSDKYWDYVGCFIKEGKSEDCLKSESIDEEKLNSCIADANRGLAYAQEDFKTAEKLGITGSPTMLMNGGIVSESDTAANDTNGRSPEAVKTLLCCGFKTKPSFCSKDLNKTRSPTMFSALA